MEEKGETKEVKVKLSTVIFCFIILILIIALVATYYIGFVKNKETATNTKETNTKETNTNIVKTNIVSNNEIQEDNKVQFSSGTYVIQPDKQILDPSYFETADIGVEVIVFEKDGTFNIYSGWGYGVTGKYTVNNNIINCIVDTAYGEYTPNQKTSAEIKFDIKDTKTIEISEVSKSYIIKQTKSGENGWVLTEEDNEVLMYPFVKGIKFEKKDDLSNETLVDSINGKTYEFITSYKNKYTIKFTNNQFIAKVNDMTIEGVYEEIDQQHIKCNIKSYTWTDGTHSGGTNLETEGWYIDIDIRGNNLIVPDKCYTGETGDSEIQNELDMAFGKKNEYRLEY